MSRYEKGSKISYCTLVKGHPELSYGFFDEKKAKQYAKAQKIRYPRSEVVLEKVLFIPPNKECVLKKIVVK